MTLPFSLETQQKKMSRREYKEGEKFPNTQLTFVKEVESRITPKGAKVRTALVKCDCGKTKEITIYSMTSNPVKTRSCGCYAKSLKYIAHREEEILYDSRWKYLGEAPNKSKKKARRVYVQCECGTKRDVPYCSIKNGQSKSCGCYMLERRTKHGDRIIGNTKSEYTIWRGIKGRTSNPNVIHSEKYIELENDPRWTEEEDGYTNFINDMGCYIWEDLSIDRIDNTKGYSKENCRWATKKEQARNRKNNLFASLEEVEELRSIWNSRIYPSKAAMSREMGIHYSNLRAILNPGKNGTWKQEEPLIPRKIF